jgi:hypothetical protein
MSMGRPWQNHINIPQLFGEKLERRWFIINKAQKDRSVAYSQTKAILTLHRRFIKPYNNPSLAHSSSVSLLIPKTDDNLSSSVVSWALGLSPKLSSLVAAVGCFLKEPHASFLYRFHQRHPLFFTF